MIKNKWYKDEIKDLIKSWLILSLAFSIVMTGLEFSIQFFYNLLIAAVTVGAGFVLHELAHKMMAQKYRCAAVYKADPMMLGVCIISSLFGFIFAAPGAVFIIGNMDKKVNGKISLAGPLTNIILAMGFLFTMYISGSDFVTKVSSFGFFINGWLAAFNMIPVGPFDGKKIWNWNKAIYVVTLFVAVALVFVRFAF